MGAFNKRRVVIFAICAALATAAIWTALSDEHHIASDDPSWFDRVRAAKEYARYAYRVKKYDEPFAGMETITRKRAFYLGLDEHGQIHLVAYTKDGKVKTQGAIADIKFKNLAKAPKFIAIEISQKSVVVDSYLHNERLHFVIWLPDGTPLNESLILNGIAEPTDTPPTNIVNTLFKQHYKRIAFGPTIER